jgi:hypothetical protein
MILDGSTSTLAAEQHLNKIYMTVLKYTIRDEYLEEEKQEMYSFLKKVLGTLVLLHSPLPVNSLSELLHLPKGDIERRLAELHAILDVPKDIHQPLRLHHPSFRDFLLSKDKCGDSKLWVDEKQGHWTLADTCIQLMSTSLKQDICDLSAPGVLVTDVKSSRVHERLPPGVQYACLYWVQHLQKSGEQLYDNDHVHQFLKEHLLHWLEALSWMRKVSEGILAITSLELITLVSLPCNIWEAIELKLLFRLVTVLIYAHLFTI